MNGEILKVMDSPRNALKLVLIGQFNAMGAFQHISILRTYFCDSTFSLTLRCIHLRISQSMIGKEFRTSTRTVQLCLL